MEGKTKIVVFWCEHAFAIYDAKPLVEKYKKKGMKVVVFTEQYLVEKAKIYLNLKDEELISLDNYKRTFGYKLSAYITHYFKVLCIPHNFSELYYQRASIKLKKDKSFLDVFANLLNIDKTKINKRYTQLIKALYHLRIIKKLDVNPDRVIVFTKVSKPFILTPYSEKIFLIMESWDHPAKEPFLVSPKATFVWNKDLGGEVEKYQNLQKVYTLPPLKFRYIYERIKTGDDVLESGLKNRKLIDEIELFKQSRVVIYPMCTSSTYFAFDGEVKFLEELSEEVQKTGLKLYIRPYPLAPKEDVERLRKIGNVIIGYSESFDDGQEMYDDELMTHKYLIIKKAAAILNIGTTFVLDAALVNKSIIQVALKTDKYGDFSAYSKGVHIRKYLLIDGSQQYTGNQAELSQILGDIDTNYSDQLKKWIMNSLVDKSLGADPISSYKASVIQ